MFIIYILLIIITVSYQTKDEPASPSTYNKNNNPNENIQYNTNLSSLNPDNPRESMKTNNNGNPNINPGILQGIFQRMRNTRNNPIQKKLNEDEVNLRENNTPMKNSIEHQQLALIEEDLDNPLTQNTLGLSSEPTFSEDDVLIDANEQNADDEKSKNKLSSSSELTTITDGKLEKENYLLNQKELGLSSEQKFIENNVPKDENEQTTGDKKTRKRKRNKKKQILKTDKNIIEDIQIQDNMEINPIDIPVSPLENVKIVKIKSNITENEKKRKRKKTQFEEYNNLPSETKIARIHCTFLGDVYKMYKKVKKCFVGHFCHSIVIGAPIILKHKQVPLSEYMKDNMVKVHPVKNESLLIVIMQYPSYSDWAKELVNSNDLVINIIHTVNKYNIDGILFSNLQPIMGQDQIDNDMMKNLIKFFKKLTKRKHSLKIGATIHMHSQWITSNTEFTSFDQLNKLVTWYSYYTISMVKCSNAYISSGTSPLDGKESFTNALDTIQNTKIDMSKLIAGIQLFPNKNNELEAFTYEEFCSEPEETWNKWCAAQPENLRAKGIRLQDYSILGVQLFYMHSDDYRSTCGCHTFPLTRSLLRGLLDIKEKEKCEFHSTHN